MTLAAQTLLDHSMAAIEHGQTKAALEKLSSGLEHYRRQVSSDAWRQFATQNCKTHKLWETLGQDPATQLSRLDPREEDGRPGWLQAMSSSNRLPGIDSQRGREISEFLAELSLGTALRHRRTFRGLNLHRLTGSISEPRVLVTDPGRGPNSADGHERIHHVFLGTPPGSPHLPLSHPRHSECISHLTKTLQIPGMQHSHDLVHALDALDNIDDASAHQIVPLLFTMLRPGGRLIVSSFAPGLPCRAYLEGFMNLWFAYRNEDKLWDLSTGIPRSEINATHISLDPDGLTVRLEIVKR